MGGGGGGGGAFQTGVFIFSFQRVGGVVGEGGKSSRKGGGGGGGLEKRRPPTGGGRVPTMGGLGGLEKRRPATTTLRLGNNRLAFLRILPFCGSDLEIDSICLVFIEFFSFNWEFKNGFGSRVVYFGSGDSL